MEERHQSLQTPKEREQRVCVQLEEKEEIVTGTCSVGLDMQGLERGEACIMMVGEGGCLLLPSCPC